MNFGVLLQNRTYVCCNVLSCLPKFTETDLFVFMCFFFQFRPRDVHVADLGVGPRGPGRPPPTPLWFIKYFSITFLTWNPAVC